jgi:predicted glycosyltransferase
VRAADKYFKVLVDGDGAEIDDAFRAARRVRLLEVFEALEPDIIVTELFPFGRRQLRFELLPMLDAACAASPRPRIVCSVRDILVTPPKPERVVEMLDLIERYYDLVLVHGDPDLIPFDETFAPAHRIADKLRYTGYVVDEHAGQAGTGAGTGEVIVSAGGGAVSEELFYAAIAARPETRLAEAPWRMLAGHALPEPDFEAIAAAAPEGVVVERARPDFTALVSNAALSISQGGYNTVMEVLAARARGVIVPYAGGLETEQTLRARLLERQSGLQVIEEDALSAEALIAAVEAALDAPPPVARDLDTGGAALSAEILTDLVREPAPRNPA